jgi:hypothetical protein
MMKQLMIMMLVLIPVFLIAQYNSVDIIFTFDNGQVTTDGTNQYYEFDIMVAGSAGGTSIGLLQAFVVYNTAAFGSNVLTTGNLTYSQGSLLTAGNYTTNQNDTYSNTVSLGVFLMGTSSPLPVTPAQLLHVKIKFVDINESTGLSFDSSLMDSNQFDDLYNSYQSVIATDTLDDTLPVELSSFTAVLSVDNYVNLLWITQSETGVQGFYVYRGTSDALGEALLISPLIPATNTSQPQSYIYKDTEIYDTGTYYYWLQNADLDGSNEFHGPISFDYTPMGNSTPHLPMSTGLNSLYPNPFNPVLTISYSVAARSPVKIVITNLKGQLIATLVEGMKDAGPYTCVWNGKDLLGGQCASGMYLVRMISGTKVFNGKVMLLK